MHGAAVLAERSFAGNPMGAQGLLSVSFATDERSRLFWERAETDLVEQDLGDNGGLQHGPQLLAALQDVGGHSESFY